MTAKKTRLRPRPKDVRLPAQHVFQRNGIPTRNGGPEGCAHCPLPERHEVHIPPGPNPISDVDQRVLGETEGENPQ